MNFLKLVLLASIPLLHAEDWDDNQKLKNRIYETDLKTMGEEFITRRNILKKYKTEAQSALSSELSNSWTGSSKKWKAANENYNEALRSYAKWVSQQRITDQTKNQLFSEISLQAKSHNEEAQRALKNIENKNTVAAGAAGHIRDTAALPATIMGASRASSKTAKAASAGAAAGGVVNLANNAAQGSAYAHSLGGDASENITNYLGYTGKKYLDEKIPFQPQVTGAVAGAALSKVPPAGLKVLGVVGTGLGASNTLSESEKATDLKVRSEKLKTEANTARQSGDYARAKGLEEQAKELSAEASAHNAGAGVQGTLTLAGAVATGNSLRSPKSTSSSKTAIPKQNSSEGSQAVVREQRPGERVPNARERLAKANNISPDKHGNIKIKSEARFDTETGEVTFSGPHSLHNDNAISLGIKRGYQTGSSITGHSSDYWRPKGSPLSMGQEVFVSNNNGDISSYYFQGMVTKPVGSSFKEFIRFSDGFGKTTYIDPHQGGYFFSTNRTKLYDEVAKANAAHTQQ